MSNEIKVSKLMTQPVLKIEEYSKIQEAIQLMSEEQIGSIIVTRNGVDAGIITAKDILSKVVAHKLDANHIQVRSIMSSPIITVEKDTTGENAIRTMAKHRVRRLPITEKGKIIGIFSTSDITKLAN